MQATNKITNKMAEQTHIATSNGEVPFQVMMKDQKNVAQGKRLVELSRTNREKLAKEAEAQPYAAKKSESNLHNGAEAVGALGLLGYYIYQRGSPGDNNDVKVTLVETPANKFKME